jgi:hypothetical protein
MRVVLVAFALLTLTGVAAADPIRSDVQVRQREAEVNVVRNMAGRDAPSTPSVSKPLHGQLAEDLDQGREIAEDLNERGEGEADQASEIAATTLRPRVRTR